MEPISPAHSAIDLSGPLYFQLVYTLTSLLPPPLDNTPDALHDRNHAAIAKVAALLPVNANEADVAAQCIAARAQAEDVLRLLRRHANDIGVVLRLNAQYASMVRTSLSVHARLMRVQALRQKRETIGTAVNADAWALHVAQQSMQAVLNADAEPPAAASPKVAPVATPVEAASPKVGPVATPLEAPAASADQRVAETISETDTESLDAAIETWLSEQPWMQGSGAPGEPYLWEIMREAMVQSGLAGRASPATGGESPRDGGP